MHNKFKNISPEEAIDLLEERDIGEVKLFYLIISSLFNSFFSDQAKSLTVFTLLGSSMIKYIPMLKFKKEKGVPMSLSAKNLLLTKRLSLHLMKSLHSK